MLLPSIGNPGILTSGSVIHPNKATEAGAETVGQSLAVPQCGKKPWVQRVVFVYDVHQRDPYVASEAGECRQDCGCVSNQSQCLLQMSRQYLISHASPIKDYSANQPMHHVVFSRGNKDKIKNAKSRQRSLRSVLARISFHLGSLVPEQIPRGHRRVSSWVQEQALPSNTTLFGDRLITAATRAPHTFQLYSKTVGCTWPS